MSQAFITINIDETSADALELIKSLCAAIYKISIGVGATEFAKIVEGQDLNTDAGIVAMTMYFYKNIEDKKLDPSVKVKTLLHLSEVVLAFLTGTAIIVKYSDGTQQIISGGNNFLKTEAEEAMVVYEKVKILIADKDKLKIKIEAAIAGPAKGYFSWLWPWS